MTLDLAVVGGGPAGLATAIATATRGLTVAVYDRREPPIDKACGEGLMPDAVARLDGWGVRVEALEHRPFRGIRYLDGDLSAEADFDADRPGCGVRRTTLHRALVSRAAELGVDLRWRTEVNEVTERGLLTSTGRLDARWIAAADGLHSRLRRWCGLDRPARGVRRFGVRRHFRLAPWSAYVEVYWADGAEAYVTPVAADEVGVAILWSGERAGFDALVTRFPALVDRLGSAEPSSRHRGAGALRQRVRGVWKGRVALVGDAAGYVDAITGEGLALAFHQAEALAAAIVRGDLASYGRACRRLARLPNALVHTLLFVERRPALRRRVIRALADDPEAFRRLLAVHARQSRPTDLGLRAPWALARGLVLTRSGRAR